MEPFIKEQVGEVGGVTLSNTTIQLIDDARKLEKYQQDLRRLFGGGGGIGTASKISEVAQEIRAYKDLIETLKGDNVIGAAKPQGGAGGLLIRGIEILFNSPAGSEIGKGIANAISSGKISLEDPRISGLVDSYIISKNPNYKPPTDINRQLVERYDQGGSAPVSQQPLFPTPTTTNQSDDEYLLSLNPDDPVSIHQFMAKYPVPNITPENAKTFIIKAQKEIRAKMSGNIMENMGLSNPSIDGWQEKDIGRPAIADVKPANPTTPPQPIPDEQFKQIASMMEQMINKMNNDELRMRAIEEKLGITVTREQETENLSSPQDNTLAPDSSTGDSIPAEPPPIKKKFVIKKKEEDGRELQS